MRSRQGQRSRNSAKLQPIFLPSCPAHCQLCAHGLLYLVSLPPGTRAHNITWSCNAIIGYSVPSKRETEHPPVVAKSVLGMWSTPDINPKQPRTRLNVIDLSMYQRTYKIIFTERVWENNKIHIPSKYLVSHSTADSLQAYPLTVHYGSTSTNNHNLRRSFAVLLQSNNTN